MKVRSRRDTAGRAPGYRVHISDAAEDALWDAFLETTPGGHHVQTSLWGQVKAATGWRAMRTIITDGTGTIVAGAQLLARPLAFKRCVGYVTKGPLVAREDPALIELVINEIKRMARDIGVRHLTVQPPNSGPDVTGQLVAAGFAPTEAEVAPTATTQVDLTADEAEILSRMRRSHRQCIRQGRERGATVRHGSRDDLGAFYELYRATAARQRFAPYPLEHFAALWDAFHPGDHIDLVIVESGGEPICAQISIAFQDAVIAKSCGWTGDHRELRPNYLRDWETMIWAKSEGYRVFDQEGIDREAGQRIAAGEERPAALQDQHCFWKLGFGGDIRIFPQAYVHIVNPVLRLLYAVIYPRVAGWPLLDRLISRIRVGWG